MGISVNDVVRCYDFALSMAGAHNNALILERSDRQIFIDDFRGKLAEVAVKRFLEANNYTVGAIDFNRYERGRWDKDDLVVNGNIHVSVKSSGPQAGYLLIEQERFDDNGNYRYLNNDGTPVLVNKYAFVTVSLGHNNEYEDEAGLTSFHNGRAFVGTNSNSWSDTTRRIDCNLRGFITSEEFWDNKKTAPARIRMTKPNLDLIWNGLPFEIDETGFRENDRRWLQRTNYIINLSEFHNFEG